MNDAIIQDIINIFNMKEVTLVRLSGLVKREHLEANILHLIIYKLNQANVISYNKCCYCTHCREIFYLKQEEQDHKCDTCGLTFNINTFNTITEKDITNITSI